MPSSVGYRACLVLLMASGAVGYPRAEQPSRVEVLLTTVNTLPEAARASMVDTTAAIWRRQGIEIDWLPASTTAPVAANRLRAMVVQRRKQSEKAHEPFAVAELIRSANGHPVALVSIESAQRLVTSLRGRAGYELIVIDQRRLGMVLGRALAHEIGHYLLGTATHSADGLMRPQFSAFEFADPGDGIFTLDSDAASWLRSRSAEKFRYAQR